MKLGDGLGGFSAAPNLVVGLGPSALAIGDLNDDGKPDVAVTNAVSATVSVLLGDGTGRFSAATNYPVGQTPYSVAMGDLDGDGDPDLAVANRNGDTISILVGDGAGQFGAATNLPLADGPASLALVEMNGDDKIDLAVANNTSNTVAILLNATAAVNHPPKAKPDSYTTQEGTPLGVASPGVLGNDADPDGDAITAELVSGPSHGALTLNANGSFTYTPAADFCGSDSFTYRARDGAGVSTSVSVLITVTPVNHAPVAVGEAYATDENAPLTTAAPGVLGNDLDPDGDALQAVVVSGPSHGALTLNTNGSFTYTPAAGYTGADSFSYQATDGQLASNTVTVAITVRYRFAGFFQPVDNMPVMNRVNPGQSVPLMFSLGGNKGLNIMAPGYPVSQPIGCPGSASVDDIEQTDAPGPSTLSYDAATDRYKYSWKTEKAWKNTCRQLTVKLPWRRYQGAGLRVRAVDRD